MTNTYQTGVTVVGAGATGLLVAKNLADRGESVCLIEKSGVAAEQSNHSHGYLHRGHIYQRPTPELVRTLNEGSDWWADEMENRGIRPVTVSSHVGFTSKRNAEIASRAWRRAGLRFLPVEPPRSLKSRSFTEVFSTKERTYDFTPWFRYALDNYLHQIATIHGEVGEISGDKHGLYTVSVDTGLSRFKVASQAVVLCAGTANNSVLRASFNHRGRVVNRMSYMMVVEADELEELSFVSPENETYGLFLVSRRSENITRWLVSNYLSFGNDHPTAHAELKWRIATSRILEKYTDCLSPERNTRWATYRAPKGELRRNVQQMNEHTLERIRDTRIYVAAPSKLTLVPLLAKLAVELVNLGSIRRPIYPDLANSGLTADIPLFRERWAATATRSINSLKKPLAT